MAEEMDIDCEGWQKILELFPDMNFDEECVENPKIQKYLRSAINQMA